MRPFGVSKTPEGLRFAYIGGVEQPQSNEESIELRSEDLKYVEEQFMTSSERDEDEGLLDVLFTWSWPNELKHQNHLNVPESNKIGPLIWNTKPRYIFTPSHDSLNHFERAPYENVDTRSGEFLHASRFIALSNAENVSVDNSVKKKKWIYALNLVPGKFATPLSLTNRPDDCTGNPFLPISTKTIEKSEDSSSNSAAPNYFFQGQDSGTSKRKFESDSTATAGQLKRPPTGYVCKKCHSSDHFFRDCIYKDSNLQPDSKSTYVCHICHEPGHLIRNCPKKSLDHHQQTKDHQSKSVAKSVDPETCWFCLSNPAARKHLIVDIGDEIYLALAKGPLTPEHSIIVPIEHISSTVTDFDLNMKREFENMMRRMNSSFEGKLCVFFRISNNPSHHYHTQAICIDSKKINEFMEFLEDFSIKLGYNFKEQNGDEVDGESFFEFSYISESDEIKRLVHKYDPSAFFPAQFGRQVLANFLEIDGGADWKNQIYTEEDEKRFVLNLKKAWNESK